MPTLEAFSGFPKKTVIFLRELAAHNNREWFTAHRPQYEAEVLEPAKAFVRTMGARLRRLSPGIQAEPRTDGSLFRIFRDTRFSPDKSPYKTNLGIYFWEGQGSRLECSGYYFHLEPPVLMLGGGVYVFSRPQLERYRRAGLYAGCEGPVPAELHSPALIDYCWERFKPMEPLHRWLAALVGRGFEL